MTNQITPAHYLVVDLLPLTQSKCSRETRLSGDKTWCGYPFLAWNDALSCTKWRENCREIANRKKNRVVNCKTPSTVISCNISEELALASTADGIMLSHIGLSSDMFLDNATLQRKLLYPAERQNRNQVWGMQIMWESTVYYPAGSSREVRSYFDYTWGSAENVTEFKLPYPPVWSRFERRVDLMQKARMAESIDAKASVVMMVSNCDSMSNREEFFETFMRHAKVDSYGRCFNNRDLGDLAFDPDGSNFLEVFESVGKIELLKAYKFMLVLENSIDHYYITEKIMHAWEASVVPLYLGAPEIDEFVPGPYSYIDLRNLNAKEAAELVHHLDRDDESYLKYHAWRSALNEASHEPIGPLGEKYRLSEAIDPSCTMCKLIHSRQRQKS